MTTIVKNIKVIQYPIPKDTLAICEKLGVLKHLPLTIPQSLEFELHNTTTALANALCRCINSELDVMIMDFNDEDVITDDSFIIVHALRKGINLIPLRQIQSLTFGLNVFNNTDNIINVYARDLSVDTKTSEELMSPCTVLTELRPGKRIIINNIKMIKGTACVNDAAYSFNNRVTYKCLDLGDETHPVSSMLAEPSTYKIGIVWQKYADPIVILKSAIKTLNDKLDKIYMNAKDKQHYSSDMEITNSNNVSIYKIFNESYTIGELLSRYGYIVDKTITNIHCSKLHPSYTYIVIEIHHQDPQSIILSAIENIKKELAIIDKAFK